MLAVDAALPVGLYLMDSEGVFLYGNEQLQKILEWPLPLLGVSLAEFLPAERRFNLLKNHREYFSQPNNLVRQTVYLITASGRQITANVQATTYALEDNFNVVVGTIEDITEEEQLRLKKDATDRVVLHDLKNPLSGFLGLAQLMKREIKDTPDIDALSDELQRHGLRLLRLLETQLALGRIESEQFNLIREPIDIETLIEEALTDWVSEDVRSQKNWHLTYEDKTSNWDFNCHATLLRVVLGQILRFGFENCPINSELDVSLAYSAHGDLLLKMRLPLTQPGLSQTNIVQWDELLKMSLWLVTKAIQLLDIQLNPLITHDSFILSVQVPTGALEDQAW